jgi:hypothetical protein
VKNVWWIDNTDPISVRIKLATVREGQFSDFEWINFNEDAYESPKHAFAALIGCIGTSPMLAPGRAVLCHGIPLATVAAELRSNLHHKLAGEIELIHDNVVFIIVAKPDEGGILYKAFEKMAKDGRGEADKELKLSKSNVIGFIEGHCRRLGVTIDRPSCEMLADLTNLNAASICNELHKLKHLATDKQISPRLVEMGCSSNDATATVISLSNLIIGKRADAAHETLQRMLDRGENVMGICGYLQGWLTRLALAESCDCDVDKLKIKIGYAKKWKPADAEDERRKMERAFTECWGYHVRYVGESVPFFPSQGALTYACNELVSAKRSALWAHNALRRLFQMQVDLRKDKGIDPNILLHKFVSDLMV